MVSFVIQSIPVVSTPCLIFKRQSQFNEMRTYYFGEGNCEEKNTTEMVLKQMHLLLLLLYLRFLKQDLT